VVKFGSVLLKETYSHRPISMVSSVLAKAMQLRRNKRRANLQSKMSKGGSPRVFRRARKMTQEEAEARVENAKEKSKRGNEARRKKRQK
jgi:hypothetical protein